MAKMRGHLCVFSMSSLNADARENLFSGTSSSSSLNVPSLLSLPYPQASSSLSPLPLPFFPGPTYLLTLSLFLLLVSRLINIPPIQLHSIITATKEHSSTTTYIIKTTIDFAHPERRSLSQQRPACQQGSSTPATNCRISNDQLRLLSNLHNLLPRTDLLFHSLLVMPSSLVFQQNGVGAMALASSPRGADNVESKSPSGSESGAPAVAAVATPIPLRNDWVFWHDK